ncbi:MAG: glycosyltransferase [Phycisphaerales bacterium]
MNRPVVLLAGGGSGGTVLPGLAVAEALGPRATCIAAISDRAVDRRVLEGTDLEILVLPARPPSVRPRGGLGFLIGWRRSVAVARRCLIQRRVQAVVALGGFVAPPVVAAARSLGIPVLAFNLDSVPGRAMRWTGVRASRCVNAVVPIEPATPRASDPFARAPVVGRPIRAAARAPVPPDPGACRRALGLDEHADTLVVTGASQGSRSLGAVALAAAAADSAAFEAWQVIHLVGDQDLEATETAWTTAGVRARVMRHLPQMGLAWGAGSLAISRAGAGSVAEIASARLPSVLLPYPWHRDRHQWSNAAPLEAAGGAVILDDRIDPELNRPVVERVIALMRDDDARALMRQGLNALGNPDGAAHVAEAVMDLVNPAGPRAGPSADPRSADLRTSDPRHPAPPNVLEATSHANRAEGEKGMMR